MIVVYTIEKYLDIYLLTIIQKQQMKHGIINEKVLYSLA